MTEGLVVVNWAEILWLQGISILTKNKYIHEHNMKVLLGKSRIYELQCKLLLLMRQ